MATKDAHVVLEAEEYERLEAVAAQRGTSVSDLIREAVWDRYLPLGEQRKRAVEAICQIHISIPDWDILEKGDRSGPCQRSTLMRTSFSMQSG